MPQIPSGHVDKIKIEVLRNPQTEVNDVESGKLDWMANEVPPDRYQEVALEIRRHPVPGRADGQHLLLLDEHDGGAVRRRQGAPGGQLRDRPGALERIYSGRLEGGQQILPPGMPGYEKLELYPHDIEEGEGTDRRSEPERPRNHGLDRQPNRPPRTSAPTTRGCSKKLGFKVTLKVLGPDNYFTVIGNTSTPDLDTGWANWFEDYPHPNDFFQPLLAEESIAPTNGTNLARFADPTAERRRSPNSGKNRSGPKQEAAYAQLDKEFMEQAPLAPYGSSTASTFVSNAINLENVIFNPTFGQDLASFEFK